MEGIEVMVETEEQFWDGQFGLPSSICIYSPVLGISLRLCAPDAC